MLLMRNIITKVPTRPKNAVCHEKYLNDGLQHTDDKELGDEGGKINT